MLRVITRKQVNLVQRFYSVSIKQQRVSHEIKIPVPWGHVAGKWWEPCNQRPILALHGWQDNCGTFDRLFPLMDNDVGVLAIDLPGHGLSSRYPPGTYYHNMNYTILIHQIANYFQWSKVSLMGHSLGGITCYVYTMLFPEIVDYLICLDGIKPLHKKNNGPRMAIGIKEFLKFDEQARNSKEPPSYSLDEMRKMVAASNENSIDLAYVDCILQRNIAPSKLNKDKFYFTRDPRIKSRLILNWSQAELLEYAKRVKCPLLLPKFTGIGYFEEKENLYQVLDVLKQSSSDCRYVYVDGSHHAHLNHPETFVKLINDFLKQYHKIDEHQGVRSEILAE